MKKNLLTVVSLALVLILALPFCVSAYTIEELEQMANGTVTDSGEGYYILEKDGKTHFIDENGYMYGEYCVVTDDVVDIAPFVNGETDEFFGVKVVEVTALFQDDWVDNLRENVGVFPYVVVLQDLFAGDEAEAVWSTNEAIVSYHRNGYTSLPDVPDVFDGDINADGVIDAFDCLIIKGIYFGTYEATSAELLIADLNGDDVVDMFDYLMVKMIYFEQETDTISKDKVIYNPDESHYDEPSDVTTSFRERDHRGLANYIETESLNGDEWFCVKLRLGENPDGTVFELNSYLAELGFIEDEALTASFRYNANDKSVVGYITAAMYDKMRQDNYAIECAWLPKACADAKGCYYN